MAGTINIRLKVDGVEKSITNIRDLETAISQAKEELKSLNIGSGEFKTLSENIKSAEGQLKNLNKQIEGLDTTQQAESFVKLGEGIVGAFTIGLTSLQTFGIENETIQQAQLKTTQLLTIAIGARQVAEGLLNVKIVANTLAQRASNLAVAAGTKLTKSFYTLIASNPYTALISAVGTLALAFITLGDNTEESGKQAEDAEKRWEDLGNQLNKVNDDLGNLNKQIVDETKLPLETQIRLRRAIEDEIKVLNEKQKAVRDNIDAQGDERDAILARDEAYQDTNERIALQEKRLRALNVSIKEIQSTKFERTLKIQSDAFKSLTDELNRLISQFSALSSIRGGSALIVEELQKILDGRTALAEQIEILKPLNQLFEEEFDVVIPEDIFGKAFEGYRKQLTKAFTTGNVGELEKAISDVLTDASKRVGAGEITIDAFNAIKTLTDSGYKPLIELLKKTDAEEPYGNLIPKLEDGKTGIAALNQVLAEYFRVTGVIRKEKTKTGEIIDVVFDAERAKKGFDTFGTFYKQFVDNIFNELKASGQFSDKLDKDIREQAETTAQGIIKGYEEVVRNEDDIRKQLQATQQIYQQIGKSRADAVFGFLLQYDERIGDIQTGLSQERILELSKYVNDEKRFYEELTKDKEVLFNGFNQFLKDLGVDELTITQLTEEQKLEIIKRYLKRQVDETASAEQKKRDEYEGTLAEVNKVIQEISNILATQFTIFSENLNLQQAILEREEQEALDRVVGNTEIANEKRLQIQEDYVKKNKELEKEQRLLQLRSQQAQAIVNTATAITNILSTWAANPVVAGILTTITALQSAAQVGIIQQQIGETQRLRRGGFLSGGASHENGGYMLGGNIEAEQGEVVINRTSSLFYRDLLNQVSQSGGGRPLVSNPYDDSRLIEALNRVNLDTPIRAYVVERDITRSQNVNKRLNQLSKF